MYKYDIILMVNNLQYKVGGKFMEKSLVLIKPDAVRKNIIGNIIGIYEKQGLKVINLKMGLVKEKIAEEHYKEHKGKDFYESLLKFITSGPLVSMILEGDDAISKIRKINGATNPEKAEEGTIRKLYADNNRENCVHSSDSLESAKREIKIWFNK